MRVKAKKLATSVIRFDDSWVTLLDVDSQGNFVYEVRFWTSTVLALRNSAGLVRLSVRKDKPAVTPSPLQDLPSSGDVRTLVDGIRLHDAVVKDTQRKNTATTLDVIYIDLTAPISAADGSRVFSPTAASTVLGTQKIIGLNSNSQLDAKNVNPPVLQTSVVDVSSRVSNREVQGASVGLLLESSIDPSVAGSRYRGTTGAYRASSGVSQTRMLDSSTLTDDVHKAQQRQGLLVQSLHPATPQQLTSRKSLVTTASIPVVADVQTVYVQNVREFTVSPTDIGFNDFYVLFDLLTSDGAVLESTLRVVGHNSQIRALNVPRVPPRVSVVACSIPGVNVLEVQQCDLRARAVRVYRKKLQQPSLFQVGYEQINEVALAVDDGVIRVVDRVSNVNAVQYRCIAVGPPPSSAFGFEFTNVVAPAVGRPSLSLSRRAATVSMYCKLADDGIDVSVIAVPPGTLSVGIRRRDLTLNEQDYDFLDVDEPVRSVVSGVDDAVFHDIDVKPDHVYEYTCLLYARDGTVIGSTASCQQQFFPGSSAAAIDVSNLEVVNDAPSLDIRFNINSTLNESELDRASIALKRQGLSPLFQSELTQQRSDLQQLVAHNVLRVDLTTGLTESFGTVMGVSFSDRASAGVKNVSRLIPGHRYKYIITTLLRSAETLFSDFQKQSVDPTTGKPYAFSPFKYLHPFTLNRGTLMTAASLKLNHAEDSFIFGQLGNPKEVTVTLDNSPPKLSTASVFRVDRTTALVRWSVAGGLERVEHFIVMKEILGHSTVAGKVHAVSQGTFFEFLDDLEPDDIGDITYRIVPVLNDYTRGASIVTSNGLTLMDNRSRTSG